MEKQFEKLQAAYERLIAHQDDQIKKLKIENIQLRCDNADLKIKNNMLEMSIQALEKAVHNAGD